MTRALLPFAWSIAALAVGTWLGWSLRDAADHPLRAVAAVGVQAGGLWLTVLALLVVPLSTTNLLSAIASRQDARGAGRLVASSVVTFLAMLLAAAVLTVVSVPPVLTLLVSPLQAGSATAGPSAAGVTVGPMVRELAAAASVAQPLNRHFLPILCAATAAGLLLARARGPRAARLRGGLEVANARLMAVVRLLLWFVPLGLFAIGVAYGDAIGLQTAGILGQFTALACAAMLVMTVALYPVTAAGGGVSIAAFAKAVWPAQAVAVSSQSSLASLPALLDGARRLGLSQGARTVLPLATAMFKVNRGVSATAKLLFVAHVYGVALTPGVVATFVATVILQSFAALGVPSGGRVLSSLPAYLAAGLPLDAIVLLDAADAATDVFKTVLNVTADLSVATLLARPEPAAATAPAARGAGSAASPAPGRIASGS